MSKTTELATVPESQLATSPSTGELLGAIIQGGVSADNVAVLKELIALKREEDADRDKHAAAAAFADLQSETPRIKATKSVPNKDGSQRYRFAPYEEIMRQVSPLLKKHGFSVSFDQRFVDGNRIEVTCTLRHRSGVEYKASSPHRVSGPPMSSEAQADGATITYAKRYALCSMLNITVETDDDARARSLNGPVTPEQAAELAQRVSAGKIDETKFLQFAGAPSFEAIPKEMYGELDRYLRQKNV